jgi:hypothetical protein
MINERNKENMAVGKAIKLRIGIWVSWEVICGRHSQHKLTWDCILVDTFHRI